MQKKKTKKGSFLKDLFIEIRDTSLFEVVWWIITLIPRSLFYRVKRFNFLRT
jgi:hypothetical protein